MAVLLISFLLLMGLGCPIAFCLLCSGTLYFISNDMALIMLVQRLTEGANTFTLLAVPGFYPGREPDEQRGGDGPHL